LIEGLKAGQVFAATALAAAFAFPGVRAVVRWDAGRRFSWPGRIAIGFVAAFGAFSALTGPLLLGHRPGRWALVATLAGWAVAVLAVETWPRRRRDADAAIPAEPEPAIAALPPRWSLALAALCVASLACAWAFATASVPRRPALALAALVFAANGWLLLRAPRSGAPPAEARLRPLKRAATAGAILLFGVALVTTTLWVREDADDLLYLSEALALPDAAAMIAENVTHRGEGLPANVLYDWQAFELWGGLLAKASGVHPMILFRTLFAPLLLLLAAACWLEIFRRTLPRGSVAVGMLIALAYCLFGISSHWTANNYLLPRPGQGKSWLIHLAAPVIVLLSYEFLERPARASWGLLLLACFAALGFAPTAVYLVPSALAALVLAHFVLWPARSSWRSAAAASAALLPVLGFGLYLAAHVDGRLGEAIADRTEPARWRDDFFFGHLNFNEGGGGLELFPLVALPLLALLLASRAQRFYAVAFTAALFATVLNPLAHLVIGGSLTGWEGYRRLFWLVPYPILLGILAAGLLQAASAARRPGLAGGAVLAAFLIAMPLTGGVYVFGPRNPSGWVEPAPYRAQNAFKMPEDLLQLAGTLARGPHGPDERILCSGRVASHLAPLAPNFDFVYTRGYQTRASLHLAGRFEEARERERLADPFLAGELAAPEAVPLLAAQKVRYVIQERDADALEGALRQAGFERTGVFGPYRLWTRALLGAEAAAVERGAP